MGGQERQNHRDLDETRKTVKSGEAKKTSAAFGQFIAKAQICVGSTREIYPPNGRFSLK
jgi:hypothetical protein